LKPLLSGKSKPRDRSEEEVLGYRKALDLVFEQYQNLEVTPEIIQHLHQLSHGGYSGDAGCWKKRNNEIIEILPSGERLVRFIPVTPEQAPNAVAQLCIGFKNALEQRQLPDIVAIAAFVLDFLCIHPFRDGNGRVSRLLSLLLLLQSQYELGRYISLERLVESSKERYYDTLKLSSQHWHEGDHDLSMFLNFFCAIIKEGYSELATRVSLSVYSGSALTEIVQQAILSRIGLFSLQELKHACPSASEQLIKKVLYEFKSQGRVSLLGKGRSARWRVTGLAV